MDETPEELEQIRREADAIDPNRYRKRFRILKAVGVGALAAGLVLLVLEMVDNRRNPCERLRDHICARGPTAQCSMYDGIVKESREDESPTMRSNIRAQCLAKIDRLKAEDGITVP